MILSLEKILCCIAIGLARVLMNCVVLDANRQIILVLMIACIWKVAIPKLSIEVREESGMTSAAVVAI